MHHPSSRTKQQQARSLCRAQGHKANSQPAPAVASRRPRSQAPFRLRDLVSDGACILSAIMLPLSFPATVSRCGSNRLQLWGCEPARWSKRVPGANWSRRNSLLRVGALRSRRWRVIRSCDSSALQATGAATAWRSQRTAASDPVPHTHTPHPNCTTSCPAVETTACSSFLQAPAG